MTLQYEVPETRQNIGTNKTIIQQLYRCQLLDRPPVHDYSTSGTREKTFIGTSKKIIFDNNICQRLDRLPVHDYTIWGTRGKTNIGTSRTKQIK